MKVLMKGMWKLMIPEFVATFMIMNTLAYLIKIFPNVSGMQVAFMVWF